MQLTQAQQPHLSQQTCSSILFLYNMLISNHTQLLYSWCLRLSSSNPNSIIISVQNVPRHNIQYIHIGILFEMFLYGLASSGTFQAHITATPVTANNKSSHSHQTCSHTGQNNNEVKHVADQLFLGRTTYLYMYPDQIFCPLVNTVSPYVSPQ